MFETTKDIWFLVLSICVVFFTAFLCAVFFYLIKLLKQLNTAINDIKTKFDNLHSTIKSGFSYFGIISEVAKMAFNTFVSKKKNKKTKK